MVHKPAQSAIMIRYKNLFNIEKFIPNKIKTIPYKIYFISPTTIPTLNNKTSETNKLFSGGRTLHKNNISVNDINKTTYSFNPFKLNTPKQNSIKNTENNIESNLLIL